MLAPKQHRPKEKKKKDSNFAISKLANDASILRRQLTTQKENVKSGVCECKAK